MPKFKRLLVPGEYLTAADMLDVVSQQNISAAAVQGMILLAAQPPVAWLLDCCCFGKVVAQDLEVFDIRRTTNVSSQLSGDGNDIHGGAAATAALEVVAAVAGVNVASQELQQQYQHHMREVLVRRQRRAKSAADRSNSSTTVPSDIAAATTTGAQPVVITSAATNAPVLQHQQECPQQQQQQQMGEQAGAAAQVASCMRSSPSTAAAAELEAADPRAAEVPADSTASGCFTALGIAPVALNSCCASHAAVAATSTQGVSKQLQLVQLSSQEAFFLVHVLHCCQIIAVDMAGEPGKLTHCCTQGQQHQQQHGCRGDGTISIQESQQQQQQQHSGHLLHVFRHPTHHGSETMSTEQLWQWCCENSAGHALTFTSQYVAYHHFRSKGWIPQPGLNFGADFVLYELHPEYAHSDYAVLVMTQVIEPSLGEDLQCPAADNCTPLPLTSTGHVTGAEASNETQLWNLDIKHQLDIASSSSRWTADDSGSSLRSPTYSSSQLQWLDAHIMQRLARQVLKQLLLFYVVLPQGLPLESPSCLQHLSVREILMQRWQPSAAGNRGFK
jgi:hypothetical protein